MDEEVIPGHILNLMCAIHLRQDHGYKAWTIARFKEHFPGLCPGDGGFRFTALHVLHHTRVGSLIRDGEIVFRARALYSGCVELALVGGRRREEP